MSSRRLRIVAYHDVPRARTFQAQLTHLRSHYVPVSAEQVVSAVQGDATLPRRAVWVTFDDGLADVVENALPELSTHEVRATLFVCPGAVSSRSTLWFDRARLAARDGWRIGNTRSEAEVLRHLKRVPDAERRALISDLEPAGRPVAQEEQLREWIASGMNVGNHTWDHPLLDRCDPEEQASQIREARAWLDDRFPGQPRVFAYPNGDWSESAERAVAASGESLGLLFDHRLANLAQRRFRLSRLRLDSTAPLARTRAVLSGVHSTLFHAQAALRRQIEENG
jgi:peptidoglycan/xylan/chitin deacetylase (PgdA/CDA1 family)